MNYLSEAIAGIQKQNMNVEIIVVDDASTDETVALAEKLNCKVLRNKKKQGAVVAKNLGLKSALGEYILFHDHDDIMNEGALLKLYEELTSKEKLYFVMGKIVDFYSPELTEAERKEVKIKTIPYHGVFAGAALFRREIFDIVGDFDESLSAGEVISFIKKIDKYPAIKYEKIDIVTLNRRIHKNNYGRTNTKDEYKDYLKIIRDSIKK